MQLRTDLTTRTEQAAYLADALAGLYQGPAP
ncbi:MAG: DNA photolyase, partial [Chloroflexus aggregans]